MTPADVERASAVVRRGGWGDREAFFRWAAGQPTCRPFVAEADGEIVGTGVGTVNGAAGWVGTIFVDPAWRGRGLGVALTRHVVDALASAGCRTLLLVASEAGRPLYERLGFEVVTHYHVLAAAASPSRPPDPAVRRLGPADLDAVLALDRLATDEDRSALLRSFVVSPNPGWVLDGPDRRLRGFVALAPWSGGAAIALEPVDGVRLLEHRRAVTTSARVRSGLLAENVEGRRRLAALGWHEEWRAPRMIRGEPLEWRPEAIWGQFSWALG